MHAQHHGGELNLAGALIGQLARQCLLRRAGRVPACPGGQLLLPGQREGFRQRRARQRRGRLRAAAKAQRQNRAPWQFADQRYVSRAGGLVAPGERAVAGEVLPAVAAADAAGAGTAEGLLLLGRDGEQGQAERPLFGAQHPPAAIVEHPGDIVGSAAPEVRGQQRIGRNCASPVSVTSIKSTSRFSQGVTRSSSSKRSCRCRICTAGAPGAARRSSCCHRRLTSTQKPLPSPTMNPRSRICGRSTRG